MTGFIATLLAAISLAGCWDVMPAYYQKRGTALYRRTFTVEKAMKDAVLEIDGRD